VLWNRSAHEARFRVQQEHCRLQHSRTKRMGPQRAGDRLLRWIPWLQVSDVFTACGCPSGNIAFMSDLF